MQLVTGRTMSRLTYTFIQALSGSDYRVSRSQEQQYCAIVWCGTNEQSISAHCHDNTFHTHLRTELEQRQQHGRGQRGAAGDRELLQQPRCQRLSGHQALAVPATHPR